MFFLSSKCVIHQTQPLITQWSKAQVSHLMVVRSSQLGSRFYTYSVKYYKHVYYLFPFFINFKFHVSVCVWVLHYQTDPQQRQTIRRVIKHLHLFGGNVFIIQLGIINPVNSNLQECLHVKKRIKKMRKILADHWARTNYVCHNRPMPKPACYRYEYIYIYIYVYIISLFFGAYASVTRINIESELPGPK